MFVNDTIKKDNENSKNILPSMNTINPLNLSNNLVKLYVKKEYKNLAFSNLKQPINNDGDTIIHILAQNLDKAGFELILQYNPKAITYDIINFPNKKAELPIHKALEYIQLIKQSDQDFIDYMIDRLGANPDIPDANNRIIVRSNNNNTKHNTIMYEVDEKINKLNNAVVANIKNLTELNDNVLDQNSKSQSSSKYIGFIKDITDYYGTAMNKNLLNSSIGGYLGKRRILNYFPDHDNLTETGNHNSFVARDKNSMQTKYNLNKTMTGRTEQERINKKETKLKLMEEKIRNKRLLGGSDNDDLRNQEKNIRTKLEHLQNNKRNLFGGTEHDSVIDFVGGKKKYNDVWNSEDLDKLFNTKSRNSKKMGTNNNFVNTRDRARRSNYRGANTSDSINNRNRLSSKKITTNDNQSNTYHNTKKIDSRKTRSHDRHSDDRYSDDRYSEQDRPRKRNKETDDIYRSFAKKIMDLLGVDEETAKFYRSVIKINIEESNPELKKRVNDALKVKEMESIFENKNKLQATLDKIDMEKYKKIMARKKEENDKLREENSKKRESGKKRDEKSATGKTDESKQKKETNKSKADQSKTDKSKPDKSKADKSKPDIKKKSNGNIRSTSDIYSATSDQIRIPKKKIKNQSRVIENGYLHSDEVFLSSDF